MALTKDQKTALTIAGIAAAVAVLYYLSRGGNIVIPAGASSVNPAPVYDNAIPGYTTFNVQPASLAGVTVPPSQSPPLLAIVPPGAGRCCGDRDGCFTSSPLDTGRGPISLEQLIAFYTATNPAFAAQFGGTLQSYGV